MSNPIFGHPSQQHQPACRGTAVLRWAALPSRVKGDQNKVYPRKSMVILCMDRILHQLVDGSSHCWQGFTVTNWKSCVLEKKDMFWRQSLKSSTITSKNRGINQKKTDGSSANHLGGYDLISCNSCNQQEIGSQQTEYRDT